MIFKEKLCQKVLDGTKTQTRRLVEGNSFIRLTGDYYQVNDVNGRRKWCVHKSYAVQPGRGKKAVGRIFINRIRRESLQLISEADAIAEGVRKLYRCPQWLPDEAKRSFEELWNSIYPKDNRWEDDPEVWVLEFELAGD